MTATFTNDTNTQVPARGDATVGPRREWHLGTLMMWHIVGAQSGNLLTLGEVLVRPGCEPPIHVHAREDETWFVLDGDVIFQRGLERIHATAGSAVLLPRGIPHGFAVQGPLARMLHIYTPSGIEHAFAAVSVPAAGPGLPPPPDGPPDEALLNTLAQAYGERGVTFVGPPLPVVLAREAGQVSSAR